MRKCRLILSIPLLFCSSFLLAQTEYDRGKLTQYFQNQEYDQAINYLKALPPGKGSLQFKADLGYAYFMDERYTEAKAEFSSLYQQQPANKQANLYLAQLFGMTDEPDSSLSYYRNLTQLQPGNYRYWQKAALLYTQLTNYDTALIYIQKAYSINPDAGKVLVQYCNLLIRQKRTELIDSLLNEFLSRDSTNQDVIAKRIDFSFKKSKPDYNTVIYWGEKLLNDSADMVSPYVSLAYTYLNVDSVDKSIAVCEWMIKEDKGGEQFLYCAALAYRKKKNYLHSNELLDECLKLNIQKEAVTYFNAKADNYEEMKQYKQAAQLYDTSYYIFQSPLDLYFAGRLFDKYLKNKTKASYYYKQFVDKRKTSRNDGERRIFEYIKEYLKTERQ